MNVIVDGLMTNYQKTGSGKAVLMIHGWGDSAKTFSALANDMNDDYQIIALDLPGFGGSQAPPELWDTRAFAKFVSAFMKKTDLKPVAVLGHSFGGAVAICMAADTPDFKKLILMASAAIRNKKPVQTKALKLAAKVVKPSLYILPKPQRDHLKRRIYNSMGSDSLLLPHMEKIYRKIISEDLRAEAARIQIPVLLIYGSKDKATPAADGLKLDKSIKRSNFQLIDAGHFLHQEQPERIAGLIKDFLES